MAITTRTMEFKAEENPSECSVGIDADGKGYLIRNDKKVVKKAVKKVEEVKSEEAEAE